MRHHHADYTAGGGQHRGFGHELQQDVFFAGAEGAADADLAGRLGDTGQHDIYDEESADDQEDADQADGYGGGGGGEGGPKADDGVLAEEGGIVRGVVGEV